MTSSKLIITKWFDFSSRKVAQWESILYYVISWDQDFQNWTVGTWNIKKIDRSELQIRNISQKCTGMKMAEKFQPCSQPRDLLMTGQMP